jgi:hypothetical protein
MQEKMTMIEHAPAFAEIKRPAQKWETDETGAELNGQEPAGYGEFTTISYGLGSP